MKQKMAGKMAHVSNEQRWVGGRFIAKARVRHLHKN
jgi:hypothetical protein